VCAYNKNSFKSTKPIFLPIKAFELEKLLEPINKGAQGFYKLLLKLKNDDAIIVSAFHFKKLDDDKFLIIFKFEKLALNFLSQNKIFISCLNLPSETIFFKSKLDFIDDKNFTAALIVLGANENKVFKVERRENFRLPVFDKKNSFAFFYLKDEKSDKKTQKTLDAESVQNQKLKLHIENISNTGIALILDDEKFLNFFDPNKTLLLNLEINLSENLNLKNLEGIVRQVRKIAGAKMPVSYIIGVEFTKIEPNQSQNLNSYLLKMLSQYYGRK
jgi:hypothetical protein